MSDSTMFDLTMSDLTMSEIAESDDSQEDVLENPLDDTAIGYLWNTLRAFEHEVVRANEVCSICSDGRFLEHLRTGTQLQEYPTLKKSFAEVSNSEKEFC